MSLPTEPIYAFIDSQNLNLSIAKDLYSKKDGTRIYRGWKLDFRRFFIYLQDKYKVNKAFLFIGKVAGNEPLYDFLQSAGYHIIFKPTLEYAKDKERIIKGNVDAELILHSMIQFSNYGKAIIVAGDGDYHCLIEYLAEQNKLLHLMIPNQYSYSSLLRPYSKYFVYVSRLRDKLETQK